METKDGFSPDKPLWSVTIKQMRELREVQESDKFSNFFIDGEHKVYRVKLVAKVVNNCLRQTASMYFGLIEDTTGELPFVVHTLDEKAIVITDEQYKLDQPGAPRVHASLQLNTYYEFIGTVVSHRKARSEPPTRHYLEISHARRINDFNAVTVHMLECIYQHLQRTRGPPPPPPEPDIDGFFDDNGMGEEDCF